jgi:hypothetical protein
MRSNINMNKNVFGYMCIFEIQMCFFRTRESYPIGHRKRVSGKKGTITLNRMKNSARGKLGENDTLELI